MAIKLGINGFGRIGRNVLRAAVQNFKNDIEIVAVNDLLEPEYLAYMLQYDSVHGRFQGEVNVEGNTLIVNGKKIRLTQERDPANLKWGDIGADIVVEATGLFLTKETGQKHIDAGAKKVVMSAPTSLHFSSAGSFTAVSRMRMPLTTSVLPSTATLPLKRPCTESYCSM